MTDNKAFENDTGQENNNAIDKIGIEVDDSDSPKVYQFTELLCLRNQKDFYIASIERAPKKSNKVSEQCQKLVNCFSSISNCFSSCQKILPQSDATKRNAEVSVAFDQWHGLARWVKYYEEIESNHDRWSKPHVTTLCPYFIQLVKDSLEITDDLGKFKRTNRPHKENEIYQAIYIGDNDESSSSSENKNGTLKIYLHETERKWVIVGGTPHQRLEVGRSIGGVFSRELSQLELDETTGKHTIQKVYDSIDHYMQHSTLIPFDSWDPRFRMIPPDMPDDDIPTWMCNRNNKKHAHHFTVDGGLWTDLKTKLFDCKAYASDWTDAFQFKTVSATIFNYFVNITPIVAFGAMNQTNTNSAIGTIESVAGAGLAGIIWSITAGQPIVVVTQTGPMMVFDKILYELVEDDPNTDFFGFRIFVGLWTFFFLMIIVFFKLSKYVKYITNFTEECFASLISLIFIVDGFKKIASGVTEIDQFPDCEKLQTVDEFQNDTSNSGATCQVYDSYFLAGSDFMDFDGDAPTSKLCKDIDTNLKNGTLCRPEIWEDRQACFTYEACKTSTENEKFIAGYFGITLSLVTLFLCFAFKYIRRAQIFSTGIRKQLADFGVIITILIMVGIDKGVGLDTKKLEVPSTIATTSGRPWFVGDSLINGWSTKWFFIAAAPAALLTILIFLEQQITGVIVNRPQHKMKKPGGYHLDLFVIGVVQLMCAFFGFPWIVAAVVQSITHVQSLMLYDEDVSPGQKPRFLGVLETRLTTFLVFLMICVSVFASTILKLIPLSVLFGVFVYMGISAIIDLEVVQRLLLLFTPVKHQPDLEALRKLDLFAVNSFTIIQVTCLVILYAIKSIPAVAIGFPLVIVVIIFVRKGLEYFYSKEELDVLDGH